MDKETAKQEVGKIVKRFQSMPKNELDSMPEEDIKFQFIEPLFGALGWKREEISKEARILKGRADYLMKIGNQFKLVVEAKKTSVRLSEEEGKQAVSYAHHKNIKFSVLTNFKEIRVYHALSNIKNIDKNLLKDEKGYLRLNCENFESDFERLWLLSRESFEKEEINKLLENVDKRLIKPIDESILTDLLQYREWLSKDLKSKRNYLTNQQIDEIVQVLIDRLIFMRSVEDRGLEEEDFLLKKVKDIQQGRTDKNLWALLLIQFKIFDKEYNSKLFYQGILEREGFFDERILIKVIHGLYYGTQDNRERYRFDDLPVDLLGSIYEQYLGVVLSGTEKRVKLELVSGKRKKMGIYYTPKYVVDYIVKNTIGEYVQDKSLDEILEIKIVDPACGSGSFLIDAFQEMIEIVEDRLKSGEKSKKWNSFQDYHGRLSLAQKSTLLLNCIFGIDLDEKAVELAQLNLLLKILEEETRETRRRILPNMKDNIRNGNSLIEDYKISGDKAFNWKAQFEDIFKTGGFDIVIGNPPYIRSKLLDKKDRDYIAKKYSSSVGTFDIYITFIEKGLSILKNKGMIGFINPNKYFYSDYGKNLRELILKDYSIKNILNFNEFQVFDGITTYTTVNILSNSHNEKPFSYLNVVNKNISEEELSNTILSGEPNKNIIRFSVNQDSLSSEHWSFKNEELNDLKKKVATISKPLDSFCYKIYQGFVLTPTEVFPVSIQEEKKDTLIVKPIKKDDKLYEIEKDLVIQIVKSSNIQKYYFNKDNYYSIFPYKYIEDSKVELIKPDEMKSKYPKTLKYLETKSGYLKTREKGKWKKSKHWYEYSRKQNFECQKMSKIIVSGLAREVRFSLAGKDIFIDQGSYGVILNEDNRGKEKVFMAILNSKIIDYFLKSISGTLSGGYYSYQTKYLRHLPIRYPDSKQEKKISDLVDDVVGLVNKNTAIDSSGGENELLKQQIKNIDYELNEEIYKLYGITDKEKQIIESSL